MRARSKYLSCVYIVKPLHTFLTEYNAERTRVIVCVNYAHKKKSLSYSACLRFYNLNFIASPLHR